MLKHRAGKSLVAIFGSGVEDEGGDNIGVDVRGRTSVLDVALSIISSDLRGDSERGSSVANSEREGLFRRSLVVTGESLLIIIAIGGTMHLVVFGKSLHHVEDVLHTTSALTHNFSGVVGVAARSIPVGEEFGSVRNTHTVVFSDTREEIARDQKFISDSNSNAGSNLVFPLSGHNLSISTRNGNSSIEAGLVMDVSNAATEGNVGTDRAVVGSLGSGVTIVGPAEGVASELGGSGDQGVFLFNSVPR